MKGIDLEGKYLIGFNTICEGHQTSKDENENPNPTLYDSYGEAFKELFTDAICGIEGNEEAFEEDEDLDRDVVLKEMNALLEEGNVDKMEAYMDKHPETNYYEDFVEKADEFVLGRKAIFNGQGIIIKGTKLEEL